MVEYNTIVRVTLVRHRPFLTPPYGHAGNAGLQSAQVASSVHDPLPGERGVEGYLSLGLRPRRRRRPVFYRLRRLPTDPRLFRSPLDQTTHPPPGGASWSCNCLELGLGGGGGGGETIAHHRLMRPTVGRCASRPKDTVDIVAKPRVSSASLFCQLCTGLTPGRADLWCEPCHIWIHRACLCTTAHHEKRATLSQLRLRA